LHLAVQNWKVHDRPARQTHLIQRVGDDPDNFVIGVSARSEVEMLSQRVFAKEGLLRQLVADDNRLWPAGSVLASKDAPVQQRYRVFSASMRDDR
jgi:hypothetical protein